MYLMLNFEFYVNITTSFATGTDLLKNIHCNGILQLFQLLVVKLKHNTLVCILQIFYPLGNRIKEKLQICDLYAAFPNSLKKCVVFFHFENFCYFEYLSFFNFKTYLIIWADVWFAFLCQNFHKQGSKMLIFILTYITNKNFLTDIFFLMTCVVPELS